MVLNRHMVVRRLHRRPTPEGDKVVLPPIYSKDPGIPGTLPVGYLSPLWTNSQYTVAVPNGGNGLQGVQPAISLVTFCTNEKEAQRSLALLKGEGVIYSSKWYDKSGEPLENLKLVDASDVPPDHSDQPGEDPPGPRNKPDEELNTAGDGPNEDDTKSKEASSSDSSSGSSSNSGSEDSSQDSSSSKSSGGESDTKSDAPKRKVRRKKRPHQSSNAESDDEPALGEKSTGKMGDQLGEEARRSSHDSGLGDGVTTNPTTGSSSDGVDALLSSRYATGTGGMGSLPLLTALPSMETLEALMDDLEG